MKRWSKLPERKSSKNGNEKFWLSERKLLSHMENLGNWGENKNYLQSPSHFQSIKIILDYHPVLSLNLGFVVHTKSEYNPNKYYFFYQNPWTI